MIKDNRSRGGNMFCNKCRNKINNASWACNKCGNKIHNATNNNIYVNRKK